MANFIFSGGEYVTHANQEVFNINICGDAQTTCASKKKKKKFNFFSTDQRYPAVHSYLGNCGYLGTRYFKTKLVGKNDQKIFFFWLVFFRWIWHYKRWLYHLSTWN